MRLRRRCRRSRTKLRRDSAMVTSYQPAVVIGFNTLRNTSAAFFISSIVPIEMRACVFSNGGKSRPTMTPCLAQASRKSLAGRPTSTNRKFPSDAVDLHPRSVERLDRESADLGVAPPLRLDVRRVAERRQRRGNAEDADVVRHLVARELLDRVGLSDRVADAHARHAERLRERPRHEDVRCLQARAAPRSRRTDRSRTRDTPRRSGSPCRATPCARASTKSVDRLARRGRWRSDCSGC